MRALWAWVAALVLACPASAALVPAGAGLRAPAGIRADVFVTGLPRPTAFALDSRGRLWATSGSGVATRQDGVWLVARKGARPRQIVRGVPTPLGLSWIGDELFVAEKGRVRAYSRLAGTRFGRARTVRSGIPVGRHQNAGITGGPDGRVYLGIGSPCDSCRPTSRVSATVVSFPPNGSDLRVVARGLRYAYGLAFLPGTADLFATENGRDDLGLNQPPDELNLIRAGRDYGYPGCWHQGGTPCRRKVPPVVRLAPHASADGLSFVVDQWARGTGRRRSSHSSARRFAPGPAATSSASPSGKGRAATPAGPAPSRRDSSPRSPSRPDRTAPSTWAISRAPRSTGSAPAEQARAIHQPCA